VHQPITRAERDEAYRAHAFVDAHRDDPEFGYRFLACAAATASQPMAEQGLTDLLVHQVVQRVRQTQRPR
jgi:hypothetical protein